MDRHARHRRTPTDRRRRPIDGYRTRDVRRFARLVEEAMRQLPPALTSELRAIQVVVAQVPPASLADLGELPLAAHREPGTGRSSTVVSSDRGTITLFRRPLEARAHDRRDLVALIAEHLVEQVAELLGWSDEDLRRAGWD